MAESDNDDLADALARMVGGNAGPGERDDDPIVPLTPPPLPRPPAFRPTSPMSKAAPPPQAHPTAPGPARPQRPAVPTVRPASPTPPNLAPSDDVADPFETDLIDDGDDVVLIPDHDASAFAPRPKPAASAEALAKAARRKRVEFRRTLIPVLLSCGVLTIAFGLAPLGMGPDSISATLPRWVTPTLVATGVVLLVLAGLNMAGVRALLAAERPATGGAAGR